MTYNPQGLVKVEIKHKGGKRKYGSTLGARPSHKDEFVQEYTNYPDNVLYYDKDGNEHPTQKPVKLLEYLCLTYSNENDLVLDPFAGSGSTGVACINTNRRFVLIEKEEKYCEVSAKRLEEATRKLYEDLDI